MRKWGVDTKWSAMTVQLEALRAQVDELKELLCTQLVPAQERQCEMEQQWERFWAYTGNERESIR